MECGEHHLTKQSDLSDLLHLCQSLQDHLKYCWVPLGGRDKRVGFEQCADAFRCVYVQAHTHVNETQYYMFLVLVM